MRTFCLFILSSLSTLTVLGQQRRSCFNDRCLVGEEYCVEEQQRCFKCQDISDWCGTDKMARDCGTFCVQLSMTKRELTANTTIKNLQKRNQNLTKQLNDTEAELENANISVEDLSSMLTNATDSLEKADISVKDLQKKNELLTGQLMNEQKKVIAISSCFAVVVILIIIIICVCCRKRKHSHYKAVKNLNPDKENDQNLQLQEQKRISHPSTDSAVHSSMTGSDAESLLSEEPSREDGRPVTESAQSCVQESEQANHESRQQNVFSTLPEQNNFHKGLQTV